MCRSPAEHKKLTNFEYVLSVELQTVKFSLGYVTVVGQYEFRQFNQVLSKLRKKADLFLRSVLFESLKLNLLSPRATLVQFLCRPAFVIHQSLPLSIFKWVSNRFFFYIFRQLTCPNCFSFRFLNFHDSQLFIFLFLFLFLQLLQVPGQAGKHIFLF